MDSIRHKFEPRLGRHGRDVLGDSLHDALIRGCVGRLQAITKRDRVLLEILGSVKEGVARLGRTLPVLGGRECRAEVARFANVRKDLLVRLVLVGEVFDPTLLFARELVLGDELLKLRWFPFDRFWFLGLCFRLLLSVFGFRFGIRFGGFFGLLLFPLDGLDRKSIV